MKNQLPIVALIYDFDGTLAPGNMQEYDFVKAVGVEDKNQFWKENAQLSKENNASEILSYMRLMIEKSNNPDNPRPITRNTFTNYGKSIPLYKGVELWFEEINQLGKEMGVQIEHYINSSGLQEMIEGTSIGKCFKHIYASRFMYDEQGKAIWPAVAVDFTGKTQFLYMINKGVAEVSSNKSINEHMADDSKRIPFNHMIYFGDGATDIPCMKLLRQQGGFAIAIYEKDNENQFKNTIDLVERKIINFACNADYSKNGDIYRTVKAIINQIKLLDEHKQAIDEFNNLQIENYQKTKSIKSSNDGKNNFQESSNAKDIKSSKKNPYDAQVKVNKVNRSDVRFNINDELLWLILNREL